jgi:hypothetical protein
MATRAANQADRGRTVQVQHHAKSPGTSVETMRRVLGAVVLTECVPFTRFLEDEGSERSASRARD